MRSNDGLEVAIDGSVAVLTLDRPARRNALTPRLLRRLHEELGRLRELPALRCLVVTGSGGTFSSGMDLDDLPTEPDTIAACAAAVDALEAFAMPTLAVVRGHFLGGGLELALACDLVVAADDAVFSDPHGVWGLVPVLGLSVRLPERVGVAKAKELVFTGSAVGAEEAARIGLIDHVRPPSEIDSFVGDLCMAVNNTTREANMIVKRMLTGHRDVFRAEALRRERTLHYGVPTPRPRVRRVSQ